MTETLTQDEVQISFPILKTEKTEDGDLLVYGKVTDGTVDSDEQIVDPEWSAGALKTWLATGPNLRVQHNAHRDPAGVGLEVDLNRDGDGAHWLKALVVEPVAKRLVERGALRAFSVGIMRPKILSHQKARGGRIAGGDLGEVSLVDRPANKNCVFSLVKADKSDGHAEWVGKVEGDEGMIKKALTPSPADLARVIGSAQPEHGEVPKTYPASAMFASSASNRLNDALNDELMVTKAMQALFDAEETVYKRNVSTQERKRLASQGHALSNLSYPIANTGDLQNAAHLARTGHGNVSAARALIARRAKDLGVKNPLKDDDQNDAKKGLEEDMSTATDDTAEKTAAVSCPACEGSGNNGKCGKCGGGGKVSQATADAMKAAMKKPPAAQDDESEPDDDGDDDDMGKSSAPPGGARPKVKPGKTNSKPDSDQPTDPSSTDDDATGGSQYMGNKAGKKKKKGKPAMKCSECETSVVKNAAFCHGCGAEFTGKAKKPKGGSGGSYGTEPTASTGDTPDQDAKGKDAKPVPGHTTGGVSKPPTWDGSTKGGDTGDGVMGEEDRKKAGKPSMKAEAPYALARAHDAFCPAYSLADVLEEYPSLKGLRSAIDVAEMQAAAVAAVTSSDLALGESLLKAARAGDAIAKTDADVLEDARAELHKSFTSMYPTAHPKPCSDMSPGMFNRSYISEGHAPLSKEPRGSDPSVPTPPEAKPASAFTRGNITAGHERPSPGSSKSAQLQAASAITTVHDHIAWLYPSLCVFSPTQLPVAAKGKGKTSGSKTEAPARKTAQMVPVTKAATSDPDVAEIMKGVFAAELQKVLSVLPTREDLETLTQMTTEQAEKISSLQGLVDQLGGQPDPALSPNRGISINSNPNASGGGAVPAERRSLVDEAVVKARDEKLQYLMSFRNSGDPVMREQAEAQISKMLK